jgi:hypothetical protein
LAAAQAEALDQQTTKIKKLQEDMQKKDARAQAQLQAQLAKESSSLHVMQARPESSCSPPHHLCFGL